MATTSYSGSNASFAAQASRQSAEAARAALDSYARCHPRAWANLRPVLEQGIGTSIDTDDVELPVVVLRRSVQRSPGGQAYE